MGLSFFKMDFGLNDVFKTGRSATVLRRWEGRKSGGNGGTKGLCSQASAYLTVSYISCVRGGSAGFLISHGCLTAAFLWLCIGVIV